MIPPRIKMMRAGCRKKSALKSKSYVTGKVIDVDTGKPVAGMRVFYTDSQTKREHTTVTNSAGQYKFRLKRCGIYHKRISKKGYVTDDPGVKSGEELRSCKSDPVVLMNKHVGFHEAASKALKPGEV